MNYECEIMKGFCESRPRDIESSGSREDRGRLAIRDNRDPRIANCANKTQATVCISIITSCDNTAICVTFIH